MEYNSQKPKMILPAYGRLVQQMVERALQEPDRQKRQAMAEHIVQVMARLRPAVARSADGRQTHAPLWLSGADGPGPPEDPHARHATL